MSHHSNWAEQKGANSPNSYFDDFRKRGMNESDAQRAADAARRAREGK